jgi:hypothetical protein
LAVLFIATSAPSEAVIFDKFTARVPDVVIVPPLSPVPQVTLVIVPSLFAFAGISTEFKGDRGIKSKPVPGPHLVYGFLTTSPNAIVEPIMPVILKTDEERDMLAIALAIVLSIGAEIARHTRSPQVSDSPAAFVDSCRGHRANVGADARAGTEPQSPAFGFGSVAVSEDRATRRTDEKGPGGLKEWKF